MKFFKVFYGSIHSLHDKKQDQAIKHKMSFFWILFNSYDFALITEKIIWLIILLPVCREYNKMKV